MQPLEADALFDDWHETTIRVRYAETDRMGVVYHANYLVWFEIGRTEFCRSRGFNYKDMEENDSADEGAQLEIGGGESELSERDLRGA